MISRRGLLAAFPLLALPGRSLRAEETLHRRPISSSGETIPVVGMGTWITFNVGQNDDLIAARTEVLREFFRWGGGMVDSSPMYGSSQAVLGKALATLSHPKNLFSATKVWTPTRNLGIQQMKRSESFWAPQGFDLMQVHNLLDWETHLETLRNWKAEGRIRYIGMTTSHGRRHEELEQIMESQSGIDFVQLTYNVIDRKAEQRLLPLAQERGIAIIVNRPYQRGDLIEATAGRPLPAWAAALGVSSWAQILLKFTLSHPAVTCAIPATRRIDHMAENMAAGSGTFLDKELRKSVLNLVAEF